MCSRWRHWIAGGGRCGRRQCLRLRRDRRGGDGAGRRWRGMQRGTRSRRWRGIGRVDGRIWAIQQRRAGLRRAVRRAGRGRRVAVVAGGVGVRLCGAKRDGGDLHRRYLVAPECRAPQGGAMRGGAICCIAQSENAQDGHSSRIVCLHCIPRQQARFMAGVSAFSARPGCVVLPSAPVPHALRWAPPHHSVRLHRCA
jgi:hypothetical protein